MRIKKGLLCSPDGYVGKAGGAGNAAEAVEASGGHQAPVDVGAVAQQVHVQHLLASTISG